LGASIIDSLLLSVPLLAILFATGFGMVAIGQGEALAVPAWFFVLQYGLPLVLYTAYEGWMLSAFGGQTVGKKALGIKVVMPDGGSITSGQAWGRGLTRALMQLTQILGLVDILFIFSKGRTTLHDRIVKTRVVRAKR
jgi:uncharacterized RDD family membrane protein YckC